MWDPFVYNTQDAISKWAVLLNAERIRPVLFFFSALTTALFNAVFTVTSSEFCGSLPWCRWQNRAASDGKGDHDFSWIHTRKQQAPNRVLLLATFFCTVPQKRAGGKGHPFLPSSGKWSRGAGHFCHLLLAQRQQVEGAGSPGTEHLIHHPSHRAISKDACDIKRQIGNWSTMQCLTSVLKFPFIDFYTEAIQLAPVLYYGHLNHPCLQARYLSKMLLVLKENEPPERTN